MPVFRAGIQQSAPIGVLADDACELMRRDAIGDGGPILAVVARLEEVGAGVIEFVTRPPPDRPRPLDVQRRR